MSRMVGLKYLLSTLDILASRLAEYPHEMNRLQHFLLFQTKEFEVRLLIILVLMMILETYLPQKRG